MPGRIRRRSSWSSPAAWKLWGSSMMLMALDNAPGQPFTVGEWSGWEGERNALAASLRDSLALRPMFGVAATDTFTRKNTNRSVDEKIAELPGWARRYQALGMDWIDVGVMAAFGCSYEGDVVLDPFCGCGTTIAVADRLQAGIVWVNDWAMLGTMLSSSSGPTSSPSSPAPRPRNCCS